MPPNPTAMPAAPPNTSASAANTANAGTPPKGVVGSLFNTAKKGFGGLFGSSGGGRGSRGRKTRARKTRARKTRGRKNKNKKTKGKGRK